MSFTAPAVGQVEDYQVLPLNLGSVSASSSRAIHYLYIHPHQPKIPTAAASRSLHLVNVPFDSTPLHIKQLLSTQIGLPAGRIEHVVLEGQEQGKADKSAAAMGSQMLERKSKKRKRVEVGFDMKAIPGAGLPSLWDREINLKDLTAIVQFVDRASMEAAMKAVKTTRKSKSPPIWGDGLADKLPPLGSSRQCLRPLSFQASLILHQATLRTIIFNFPTKYSSSAQSIRT